jgi:hypothetical protein
LSDDQPELTLEDRAALALSLLAERIPSKESLLNGEPFPEWMDASWLAPLTDPSDPRFEKSVVRAEEWLASH